MLRHVRCQTPASRLLPLRSGAKEERGGEERGVRKGGRGGRENGSKKESGRDSGREGEKRT